MIQGYCYSTTEPHQQQHHRVQLRLNAPRRDPCHTAQRSWLAHSPVRGDPFLPAQNRLVVLHRHFRASIISIISTAASKPDRGERVSRPHFLTGAQVTFLPVVGRGDSTHFGFCRLLIARNRTKGMSLRREGKRHVQFWPF